MFRKPVANVRPLIVLFLVLVLGIGGGSSVSGEPAQAHRIKDIPRDVDVNPKNWQEMYDSHAQFSITHDARTKMRPRSIRQYEESPLIFDSPKDIWVWTLGQPALHRFEGNERVPHGINFHGRQATAEEIRAIGLIADIDWTSSVRPFVSVDVVSKAQIQALAALPFIYQIELEFDLGAPDAAPYKIDWIREQQHLNETRNHRDAWDGGGSGAMPDSVWFAILDGGYDPAESLFATHHAESQIDAHQHDWTAAANGIAGPENNQHGTLVADIVSLMNFGGGKLFVHQVFDGGDDEQGNLDNLRQALEDIELNHAGIDVITLSGGVNHTPANVCRDDVDDVLSDLMQNLQTVMSAANGNPNQHQNDPTQITRYPGSSTFVFGVGGALDGVNEWPTPIQSRWGQVLLTPLDCPLQYQYHAARDGAVSIFKPDVYGMYRISADFGEEQGTSFATPEVASGLGTIESRFHLNKTNIFIPWKFWNAAQGCWEGAYLLLKNSHAPDGREVTPAAASMLGDMADHDAWFQNSFVCGPGGLQVIIDAGG